MFKIKRNKLNRQEAFNFEKRSRFGIRKLTIGVVSLVIGSGMVLNGVEQVYAGTDADNGEIRHVRNGSPKEMAEGSAVPGTIAEKANYRDYKIETVPVVVDGVQYVDVTLTFNERGRAYSKNRFYVFNMPNSLYEPKVITREVYQQAVEESQARVGNQTYTDYKVVASVKTSTLTTSGWREEPTNVAPGTERWGVNYRYINGNPKSSAYNSGDNTMKQIIGPGNNNSGEAISWIYTSEAGYNNDWDRLISHGFDRKAEVVSEFKNKSNSIYIDQARHSREKVVYKFRARVKDQNADMNFIFGMNEMIVNGHANFVAKYGKTPDNRPYKERFPVNTPAKITVDNTSNLTRDNKLAIIAKIKEANSSLFGSDNSLKTPILIEPTEADIPTNATSGNITLRYTDGSTTTIPVANTVRQKVVATNNPAPKVVTALNYDAAKNSATKTENGLRTRIQLPEKLGVTDLGQITNSTAKIDPSNTNNTAENLWNAQLNAIREKNIGTGGTFAENTYINSIGSATNPTENTGLDDSPWADKFSATLVKSNNQIQGILIKGPRSKTENVQADVGLITADMLFKNAGSLEPIRQSALQEIDALGAIDGKDGWKNEINSATSEEAIQAVVDKAKRAKAEFDKKKDAVKAKIDALTNLTPEQKEQFKQRVDNTTQSHMLEVPYEDAVKAGLAKEKEQAIALINSLEHLPETGSPSKQESIEWINDPWIVPDSATLKNEVTDALINNAKIKANKELDAINPAPSNLAELKRQINEVTKESAKAQGKTGQEIIEAIVEKAKADSLKEQAKKDIAAVPGLSSTKKDEYKAKIDAATNVRDLEQIVSEAKAHAKYETAKRTIQGLPNLNNAQKEVLLRSLDDDKTQAGIAATLDEARQQDSDMARLKELETQAEELKNTSYYRDGAQDKKTALDDALAASKAITPSNGQRPTVDLGQMIRNLEDGIKGLGQNPVARTVDKSSLNAEIERENSVKAQNNYSYQNASQDKKQAYEEALQEAKDIKNREDATQDQVNAATDKLRNARLALDGHAPERQPDTTAPVLGQPKQTPWSNNLVHGASTIGKRAARPGVSTTEDVYGKQTTDVVELIVTDDESDVDLNSVQFTDTASSRLRALGLEYVPYDQQKTNGAIGYFATIGEGLVKDTGTEIVPIEFTVANTENVRSQTLTFQYLIKDDIAPTATVTEHVLIKDQDYNLNLDIRDNSLLGTEGPITVGDISIKPPGNSDSEPLTPTALGVTNGTSSAAFRLALKTPTPYYFDSPTSSRGNRSHEATLSFAGRPTAVLPRTTYRLRLYDSNHPTYNLPPEHRGNESFTDITFTVVDRLAAPAESAKVSVNNPSRLTEEEKNAIKQAVKTANPHISEIDNAANGDTSKQVQIVVANNGQVTVTYPHGGKTDTLTAQQVSKTNPAPTFGDFGVNTTSGNSTYKTIFVFGAKTNGSEVVEYAPDFVPANATGGIPVQDNTGIAKVELIGIENENKVTDTGIAFTREGKLVADFDTTQRTNLVRNGINGVWHYRIKATDNGNPAKSAITSTIRIKAYRVEKTDETAIAKVYGTALTQDELTNKLRVAVSSGMTVPADNHSHKVAGYTPENGQFTAITNISELPTSGNYTVKMETTNVYGQTIVNNIAVDYNEQKDVIEPIAPTQQVLIDNPRPTTETDKNALINALKEANKTPEDTSKFPENTTFDVAEDGTVTITYPDRSSEQVTVPFKQKDSAQHTPVVAETPIDSATTAGTPLTETERNAVKAAVTVPTYSGSGQPTVTVPADARVTNGTNGNTGKPVVVATVEYPDGTTEQVEVPVRQRDNAKYEATVTNPDTPAAIKASHETGSQITDQEDKNAILAKVSVPAGSNGTPSLDQNPVVEVKDGKQVVKVTVTYGDQTKDEVFVPVDQKDNETHNPTAPAESVKLDAPATANSTLSDDDKIAIKAAVTVPANSGGQVSLPEGAKVELENDKPVVKATVTYPDGTKDFVDVPVVQKDSTKYDATAKETPVPLDSPVTPGQTLSAEEKEALKFGVNVPVGSNGEIHVPDNAAVKLVGDKPVVEAEVRYPDGTVDKVQVPVRQYDRAVYTPNLVEAKEVPISVEPTNGTSITSPDDAAILANVDVPAATQDGTKPKVTKTIVSPVKDGTGTNQGKKVVEVEITYPDKSKEKIEVPVKHADNQVHNPEAPAKPVQVDAPAVQDGTLSEDDKKAIKDAVVIPDGSGGVASLPEDSKVVDRNGTPVVPVTVTYPDNTTDTVYVPVVQKDSVKYTPSLTDANSPVLTNTPAKANEPVQEDDKAAIAAKVDKKTLPQGTETKVPDDAVVELENGKPVVPVLVSYPDGTSETIKVPVDQKDDLTYNPTAPNKDNAVAITSPQTPGTEITDPTDKAAILDSVTVPAVDGGHAPRVTKEITSPVTEGPDGPYVTVTVTYPDDTSETVNVPVNQKDNETHNPTVPETAVQVDAPAVQDGTLSEDDKKAIKDAVVIPDGSGGVASLPEDAKVELVDNKPVVPVTVTYPDNTKDTVYVPVVQKDSVKYTPSLTDANSPVLTDTPAKAETPVQDTDKAAIAAKVDLNKLPAGTTAAVLDGAVVANDPLTNKPVVPVKVTYPDGTSEFINVPVDQKDSETYTPTAPAAEAPVAITGSDAPDAPIAEADKPAILNSVTVPAVDGGQAPKVTKEITSPVKVVDGKAFVEVTVTYPDKTSEVIPVPVNQKDNEANTPTVTAPEKPAPISVPVAENTPVETDADKKLITDKVNVAGLPNPPQSVKVAEPAKVVLDQAGNPVVNVEVTYPDGTKDIVPVPVKQADNQTNTPSLKDPEVGKPAEVLVAIDPTPGVAINNPMDKEAIAAKVDLSKLPAGTTAEVADGAVVANDPLTNKPVVPVTVTYPDGTSETINVPVKQADNLAMDPSLKDTNPVPILTEATVGLTVSDKANLDAIVAKVDPKTGKAEVVNNTIVAGKEDGPHAGQPVVNVLVTYPDGTQDTIEVPVKQADNVVKEPSLTDQTPVPIQAAATTGTTVPADDKPAILAKVDLPAGAEATIADDATVVREDGQAVVPVTVTYPDGTTDTISVPVKRADNSKYTPSQVTDTVQVDAATAPGTAITSQDDKDAIIAAVTVPKVAAGEKAPVVSLPENTQVEVVNDQPVVKAIVTYADGTTDTVDVPIVQKVSATKEPSLKEAEAGKPAQAVITENPTAGASITDPADQNVILDKVVVPEGGKASIADDAVVEMDGGQPVLPVTVTYTDGSKDIIKVPVKQADNVAKEPSLKSQTPVGVMDAPAVGAQVEEPADLEAIKNNVDTKGGTASIEDPTIVEGPNNQPAVAVKVTYPDGTADTILVPIKTADNVTYTPVLKSTDPVLVSVATDNGTAVPEADQAKILANVDVPALTADGDKPAVDLSIENPVVLQKNGQAGVEVTVTYQDGSKDKIFVPVDTDTDKDGFSNKEEEKAGTSATDPASTPAGQDSAERLNPGLTEPVEVKNPDKLTDAEKEAVKKAVEDSNDLPAGTTVSVANDGTVTVTYPDNSTDTIKPKDAVTQFVDTDGDGISDRQETENGTDPSKVDSDNDGFSDKEEVERGTDPTKADSKPASSETDTDGDGISNEDEVARGTDPNKSDTDGDGFSDQEEITAGSNPTKADSTPANVDKDGDGFTDTEEAAAGTDANNPASTPAGQDSADRLNPGLTEPVEVKNPDKLTDAEKESVKKAVEDSNDLPEGTEVTVSDNGTVTVTYPDKSTDTIQPAETVKVAKDTDKDGFTDTEEAAAGTDANNPASTPAGQDSADRLNPGLTEPVEVKNPDKLTDAEKESVKKAVEDSNDLPEGTEVTVSDNGTVTVTYPDKSTDTIQPAETVKVAKDTDKDGFTDTEEATAGTSATDPSSTPAGQDSAGQLTPSLAEPVEVKNPDKLTDAEKESVKKAVEDSNDLPKGTEVTVSDNGTVTVTYPDKSTDTIQPAETVKVAKDTDKDGFTDTEEATAGTSATDPSSTPAGQDSADRLNPGLTEPVEVKNPDKLTDAEKESVKRAVEETNDLPAGTEVSVSDSGTVTVTYPDKSTDTIQPAETVKVAKDTDKDGFTDTEEATAGTDATNPASTPAGQDSAGQLTPGLTEPVEVKNPDKLTDAEKDAVKKAVEDSNDLPEGTEVTVSDNGTVTVTYPDKSTDTIQPAETVKVAKDTDKDGFTDTEEEKAGTNATDPSSTPAGQDSAGQLTPSLTEPVEVKNPDKLTDAEKEAVKKAVEDSNDLPEGTEVTVSDNGTVTVTYPDKSADTIQPTDTVKAAKPVSETPVAPSKPEVTATDSGAVVVTPPTDNVTNLDITFTPEGASQPVTVVVSKDENGIWTAPADSGLVINSDGTITIPAEKVADGTAVTVVAENGSISSPEVGSTVVPVPAVTPETPVAPSKPEVTATDSGAVVVTPPTDNVTNLDITFTPEGSSQPVTVVVSKDATGTWTAPADSGLVVNPDGTITIPADRLADGTEGQVGLVAKNGDLTSNDPAPQVPETPAKSSVETNENGSVTIVPPVENVTGIDITFTPEGASQPVTVVVSKDATGAWTAPADSGLVVNPDGTITIPADKVADGTAVSVVTKNGQVPSDEASATYVPAKPASTDTPVVEVPATPSLALDGSGNVLITPPAENATSLDITFTPAGSETPITVTANKDATGNWILPETSIAVVNPDGTISISTSEMEGGTAVSVVAKNEGVPSSQAATLLVQPKQTAEELAPTVKKPIAVEDASKLTDAEKKELEDVVRKDNVLPEGTEVSVADDGTVTVTYPDKSTDTILPTKTVMDAQNGKGTSHSLPAYDLTADEDKDGFTNEEELKQGSNVADAKSVPAGKSSAERLTPTNDLAVKVKDLTKLSDAEKETVETAIRKDKDLPEGTQIEVANDGSVTITYPDGSIGRLPADQTVLQVAHGEGTSHSLPAYDLTADEDKDGFTNEEELKQGSNVADAKSVPAGKSSAERLTPTNDLAVKVKDLTKLTDAEKKAVETAIRKNNTLPEGTQIEVANDGSVTITYPDGSVDQIVATKVVATDSTVSPDSGVSQSSGTTKVLPGSASSTRAAKKPLPATGENGSPILVLSGLALLAGVAMFRKAKREDEN
ncbi:Rib/alpha-like domain-containing protein [Streptococcus suis]